MNLIAWICSECKLEIEQQLTENMGSSTLVEIDEYTIGTDGPRECEQCGRTSEVRLHPLGHRYLHMSKYCGCPTCRPGMIPR